MENEFRSSYIYIHGCSVEDLSFFFFLNAEKKREQKGCITYSKLLFVNVYFTFYELYYMEVNTVLFAFHNRLVNVLEKEKEGGEERREAESID